MLQEAAASGFKNTAAEVTTKREESMMRKGLLDAFASSVLFRRKPAGSCRLLLPVLLLHT